MTQKLPISQISIHLLVNCCLMFALYCHQERGRTRSESALMSKWSLHPKSHSLPVTSASSSYHIVHIDTKYVTGFSGTPDDNGANAGAPETSTAGATNLSKSPSSDEVFLDHGKDYRKPPEMLDSSVEMKRMRMRKLYSRDNLLARGRRVLARKRAKQPYEVPWRLTQSFQESMLSSRSDAPECKSNSSSPVKPINPESLPRSRSLDNIDFSTFCISESQSRLDIEHVATDLKNLHVTDS